jgi:hypothetical protein
MSQCEIHLLENAPVYWLAIEPKSTAYSTHDIPL